MEWEFDQAPNVACVTCQSVIDGHPILLAVHYEDDHSWAFLDGLPVSDETAMVVAMSTVVDRHPDLREIADLAPGWTAARECRGNPWSRFESD